MPVTLLPYRLNEYTTVLNEQQIGQSLDGNVLTGFSLFDSKPYYGGFTTYSFSVRKTRSIFKKESLGPSIEGAYDRRDGRMMVTISVKPHPVLIGIFGFFFLPMGMLWMGSIFEFFKTWEADYLFSGFIPMSMIYGIFWLVFQVQCSSNLRFWEHALQLRKFHA